MVDDIPQYSFPFVHKDIREVFDERLWSLQIREHLSTIVTGDRLSSKTVRVRRISYCYIIKLINLVPYIRIHGLHTDYRESDQFCLIRISPRTPETDDVIPLYGHKKPVRVYNENEVGYREK